MPPISDTFRLSIWIITGIAGAIVATLSVYLEENIRLGVRKLFRQDLGGRRPSRKPRYVWIIYFTAILLSIAGTSLASTAPSISDISPQAFPPAENGETLIVIVPFAGSSENFSVYPERYIRDALQESIARLNMSGYLTRLEIYPTVINTERDVRQVGESYKATLMVWGEFDDVGGIRVYIEILSGVPKRDSQLSSDLIPFLSLPTEGGEVLNVSRDCVLQGIPKQANYLTMISLGMINLVNGNRDQANDFFTKAIEAIPIIGECQENPHQAYYWRGFTRSLGGDFQTAVEDLNQAITLEPNDRLAIAQRGAVYLAIGRASDAEKDFRNAINLFDLEEHESLAVLYDNLGVSLALQGQYQDAEKYLKQTNQLMGEDGDKLVRALNLEHLGSLYQLMGQLDTAYEYQNQAVTLCQEIQSIQCEAVALGNIGIIFKIKGDLDTAIGFIEKALKLSRDNQFVLGQAINLVQLGDIYLKQGELEDARVNFEDALDISEQSGLLYNQAQAYIGLAMIENQLGNSDMVMMNLQVALQILESIGSPEAILVRQKIQEIKP